MATSASGPRIGPPDDRTGPSSADAEPRVDGHGDAAVDDASLRSFILEVSAGRPQGVADATDLALRIDSPDASPWRQRTGRRRLRRAPAPVAEDAAATPAVVDARSLAPAVSAEGGSAGRGASQPAGAAERVAVRTVSQQHKPRALRTPRRRRQTPAWMVSSGFNVLVVSLLLLGKLPGVDPLDELLWATAAPVEEVVFSEVDLEAPSDESPVDGDELQDQLVDPGEASLGQVETAAALAALGDSPTLPAGSIGGDMGALFGENGAGLTTLDDGIGGAPTARFFGQEIVGRRIVFVLDNSGSMQGGRLETVIAELLRCVDSLREDQEFYVLFHSDMVYPLFYPDPVDRYLAPTKAAKAQLARWLDSVELCLGDSVDEAIAAAASIGPDAVYLLSDGRIQGDKTIRYLLAGDTRDFPIHTFAVGMGSSVAGRRNLADVAAANGGEFRESEIPDEMRELARREMRPYHSEQPGPIWGRRVKPFRPRG